MVDAVFSCQHFRYRLEQVIVKLPHLRVTGISPHPGITHIKDIVQPGNTAGLVEQSDTLRPSAHIAVHPIVPDVKTCAGSRIRTLGVNHQLVGKTVLIQSGCSCEKICPVFPVPRNTVCCPIGKFKVFLCLRWHSVPPFNFVANKKASSPFGLLAMESTLFLFVFCGKLFCRFQQSFKGLLFFRLLNQFYEKCTENIGAVMPGRCGNLVDEVM
jgi:hypothetical protein